MASDAVTEAVENLREALLADGMDEETADAKLAAVKPNETNLTGNLADLQRGGAAPLAEEEVDYSSWTKADLQAVLDAQGIEYNASATKADLLEALGA